MPIDLSRIPKRLTDAAKTGTLIPFIGAGISRSAVAGDSGAYPSWPELLKELCKEACRKDLIRREEGEQIDELVDQHKYLMAAQALRSMLPKDEVTGIISRRFMLPDARPGPIHRSIFKLRPPLVITTNYDLLLEDAYAHEYRKQSLVLTYKEASNVQGLLQRHRLWQDRPIIFKIHGCALDPSDAILSEMDYRNLLYRQPGYRLVLSAVFVTKVVLMLGFSFDDPELRLLMESLRDSMKYDSEPDYILLKRGEIRRVELRRWRDDFGLEAIEYDASPDYREVLELIEHLATFVPEAGTAAGATSGPAGGAKSGAAVAVRAPRGRRRSVAKTKGQ